MQPCGGLHCCGANLFAKQRPIVLTYNTNPAEKWLLGITAALHGLPLVLIGEGQIWHGGGGDKLGAAATALERIHALSPRSPVIFGDGSDTVVSNPVTTRVNQVLQGLVERDEVLFASECGSFPMCYKGEYNGNGKAQATHQQCRKRSKTCFPNSGLYAGSSSMLLKLLPRADHLVRTMGGAEQREDQAAVHRLVLSNSLPINIDEGNQVFFTMRPCRYMLTRMIPSPLNPDLMMMFCYYKEHDGYEPFKRISRNGSMVVLRGWQKQSQYPLVFHANGWHNRLKFVQPVNLDELFQNEVLLEYPVLLLNASHTNESCYQDTLGNVLHRAKRRPQARKVPMPNRPWPTTLKKHRGKRNFVNIGGGRG